MKVRFSYRIYPTSQQQKALFRLFGCVRVVFNDSLALCRMSSKLPKVSELQKAFVTLSKQTNDRKWLSEVSAIPLQQSIADLGVAYKNFFASLKSNKKVGYPKFKRRSNRQSARFTRSGFSIKRSKVYLAKIGLLTTKWSRPLPSEPSSVTVIKDCANRYFLSFVVEIKPISKPAPRESIGVDLGIKIFAAVSNEEKIYAPCLKQLDRKMRKMQKRLSMSKIGSRRREVLKLKLAKIHAAAWRLPTLLRNGDSRSANADKRKDFLHKLSTRLVRDNKLVVLEDLAVSNMVKNRKLARAIFQQGWNLFRTMCEAKSNKYLDREVRVIDRWQPTSQICSSCGYKWGKLDLSVREIVCLGCGKSCCRDTNAAEIINNVGVGHTHDNKWTVSDSKTLVANCSETSTRKLEIVQLELF